MQIINKFQTNIQGQVITVGEQDLLTIQSGALDSLVKEKQNVGAVVDARITSGMPQR